MTCLPADGRTQPPNTVWAVVSSSEISRVVDPAIPQHSFTQPRGIPHLQVGADIVRQVVRTFWAHKPRVMLTMFGIAWGVASLLLLVGMKLPQQGQQRPSHLGKIARPPRGRSRDVRHRFYERRCGLLCKNGVKTTSYFGIRGKHRQRPSPALALHDGRESSER